MRLLAKIKLKSVRSPILQYLKGMNKFEVDLSKEESRRKEELKIERERRKKEKIEKKEGRMNKMKGGEVIDKKSKMRQKVSIFEEKTKLESIRGVKEVPVIGEENRLITAALPYCNNLPHLGTIIGCVLSGDVFARYCRLMGYNTLYVSGTDEHGTTTVFRAMQEGLSSQQICDKYFALHQKVYTWFDIDFNIWGQTHTHLEALRTQEIFTKLHNNGFSAFGSEEELHCATCKMSLADRFVSGVCPHLNCGHLEARGDQCNSCNKLLNAHELINPICKMCKNTPTKVESEHVYLSLDLLQEKIEKWFKEASVRGGWSQNGINITNDYLQEGLRKRCISRNLEWGVQIPLEKYKEKVFYVWFDAPVGYISMTEELLGEDYKKWWLDPENVKLTQFIGKDNVAFHSVMFPGSLMATGDNYTLVNHLSTTEFLNYENTKFSKTEGVGVFGDQVMDIGINSEVFRYYLLANRPELADSSFNWDDLAMKNNGELLANLGNLSNRILPFIAKNYNGVIPEFSVKLEEDEDIKRFLGDFMKVYVEYESKMESVHLKEGLKKGMEASKLCNGFMQSSEPWKLRKEDAERAGSIINALTNVFIVICHMLEPFIPSFSAKVYKMAAWDAQSDLSRRLLGYLHQHKHNLHSLLTLLPPAHNISSHLVAPVIRESNLFIL